MYGTTTGAFIGGCVTLYFGGLIAAAGGVGGGGLIVPILLLIFGYDFDTAVDLSVCMVVGSSFAQLIINIFKRHPTVLSRPLIYWELVLTLLPSQLGGSNVGQILSKMLPTSAIYVVALLVLFFASSLTLKKGLHKWHMENEKFLQQSTEKKVEKHQKHLIEDDTTIENPLRSSNDNNNNHPNSKMIQEEGKANRKTFEIATSFSSSSISLQHRPSSVMGYVRDTLHESLTIYTDKEAKHKLQLPTPHLITLMIMWISCTSLSVGRTLVEECSSSYLSLIGLIYVPIFITHVVVIQLNYPPAKPSTQFDVDLSNMNTLLTLMVISYFVGVVCSMLGIGGGEIFSPIILSCGVIPEVTSATTATMSFLNTLTQMLRNISKGVLPLDLGLLFFGIGLLGGLSGRQLGLWVAAKYGRASVIILFLTLGLYLACLYYIYTLATESFDSTMHAFC
jgi:uncharacterized membrane protein YfcA